MSNLAHTGADFIFGDNGHARLSQRKVGELLGISQKSVSLMVASDTLFSTLESQTIIEKGFTGDTLSRLVIYYAYESRQASADTKQRCRDMIAKTSGKGFQDFIDALAGISHESKPKVETPQILPVQHAMMYLDFAERFERKFGELNPTMQQIVKDGAGNALIDGKPQLTGSSENWMGVVNFAELELGYKVATKGSHCRTFLGLWVVFYYPHLAEKKDRRLCNETQQKIWVYPIHMPEVCEDLTKAIQTFFKHPAPGEKLKADGAYRKP